MLIIKKYTEQLQCDTKNLFENKDVYNEIIKWT